MRPKSKNSVILAAIALGIVAFLLISRPEAPIVRREYLLGTLVEIKAWGRKADAAVTAAFQEIARIERLMGRHGRGELARVNGEAHGKPIPVSEELFALLEAAEEYRGLTLGAFDITLGKLIDLWGFSDEQKPRRPPEQAEIEALLHDRWLRLDEEKRTIELGPNAELDLGGIAKGYAVDRAIAVLKEHGVEAALVDAGGDIRVLGGRPSFLHRRPFRIAIQHPRAADKILGVVELTDKAIATSGDYERYFIHNDVRYHHILDPATGWPARGCISVTIIAPTALEADALATGVFVLGPERGLELINKLPGVEGIIVGPEGRIYKSSGLQGLKLEF